MKTADPIQTSDRVLVIGGGVGGIRTALDLAEARKNVILIDKANAIGGLMTLLDRTFPTNNCDLCTLSPTLSESSRNQYIQLMPLTQIVRLDGEPGNFTATLITSPRHIDMDRCTACGQCRKQFPECVDFSPGLDHRAPTCMRYPQATPQAFFIDMSRCADPRALVACCPAGAILADDPAREVKLRVASVVLAQGAAIFDPAGLDSFSYGRDPDVLTSLEYERILSASGPTQGRLVCPSDGRIPAKIAWIQCVGSRGLQKGAVSYCSGICCMFALKEAVVTKERFQDSIDTAVFYMDMRTFGKDYERYYDRSRTVSGVRFVRSRPHSVFRTPGRNQLSVTFADEETSALKEELFDLVVLSTGFRVTDDLRLTAECLGIELNSHGFAQTGGFDPVATSRSGVYVCGMFEGPKDIPETMIQASAAACRASAHVPASALVSGSDGEFIPERDVTEEAPRVGVFICDCGENIGGVIDIPELAAFAAKLPGVIIAEGVGHGCSRESMKHIEEAIVGHKLNRVVIGGCSPRTHETRFQDLLRRSGLNRYLVEIANLRDQDTWVHPDHPKEATAKARQLIWASVQSVKKARSLADNQLPINRDILVVGGGVAGMSASLRLADQGFKVFLAERHSILGGVANLVRRTLEGEDVQLFIQALIKKTLSHPNIQVIPNAFIVDHSGMPGMFKTGMQVGPQMFYRQITHGVTIMATGALPNRPDGYLLGRHAAVMTQLDADALLEDAAAQVSGWNNVVMIQCVGSRQPDNPNCSRICCQAAVKNALRILDIHPEARIFILYRDMRTYGFQEDYYQAARKRGVIFVRYESANSPEVREAGNQVQVAFTDPILGRRMEVTADALLLSTGFVSDDESGEDLAAIFKIPRTPDGYFLEDHIKLRPVDFSKPGFFMAGTAHSPRSIRESIAQAEASAARAQTLLSRDSINLGAAIARVDSKKCAACLVCVRACPFGVPFINADGYSEIDPSKCHGCGVCASECPAKAIQLMQFEDDQILAKLNGMLERMVA
ncbi:MAG: CoB--CoM heterodisulfide reductase iron-sulfur subunit A family protein [Desulfobacteraceae bacterium]|nr:MAG: CoB--CoM heterodisulfide reductase iron-sulfur subunit A family protein [Desulfobacteraceae bacterium]